MLIVTVSGEGSSSVFDCKLPLYDIVSYGVFDMMKQDNPGSAVYPSAQAYACLNALEDKGKDLILPRLSFENEEILYSGMTVFRDDKAVGDISAETARRYLMLMGKLSGGEMTLSLDGEFVSFEIEEISSDMKVKPDSTAFETAIRLKIAARQLPENCELSEAFDEIKLNFGSDVFAFGNLLYRKKPAEWKNIKDCWHEIFKNSSLEISCECVIDDSGRTAKNAVSDR